MRRQRTMEDVRRLYGGPVREDFADPLDAVAAVVLTSRITGRPLKFGVMVDDERRMNERLLELLERHAPRAGELVTGS